MHGTNPPGILLNEVTALFDGSATSFSLSINATCVDLADRLEHRAERPMGMLKAIYLKLGRSYETEGNP